ncbi:hypothetical protein TNCV_4554101 [Trichonephila clavipes]|nr:hypothetical protein TNCV_4554101 [Trichonephila clavipes]
MEWYEQQSECCPTQLLLLKRIGDTSAKKRRCTMGPVSYSAWIAFGFLLSEWCPVPIDSDKRHSTVLESKPIAYTDGNKNIHRQLQGYLARAH